MFFCVFFALLLDLPDRKSLIDKVFTMLESTPSARYSRICNVLHLWNTWFILTYDSMIFLIPGVCERN